jgi:hypothetical protein
MEQIIAALIFYALALVQGQPAAMVGDARVTSYVPEHGGVNCMEPCDKTAFMSEIEYGVTAACGPSWPWNTRVVVFTPWRTYEFRCQDRGGGITDDRVDVAMTPDQHDRLPLYGNWPVVWITEGKMMDGQIASAAGPGGPPHEQEASGPVLD